MHYLPPTSILVGPLKEYTSSWHMTYAEHEFTAQSNMNWLLKKFRESIKTMANFRYI